MKSSVLLGTKPRARTSCSAFDKTDAATELGGATVTGVGGVVAGVVGVVGAGPLVTVVRAFALGRDVVVTRLRAVDDRTTFGREMEVGAEAAVVLDAAGVPVVDEAAAFDEPDELQLHNASTATQRNAERAIVRAGPLQLLVSEFVTARRLLPGAQSVRTSSPAGYAIGTTALANVPRHHVGQPEPSHGQRRLAVHA